MSRVRTPPSDADDRAVAQRGRSGRDRPDPNHGMIGGVFGTAYEKNASREGGAERRKNISREQDEREKSGHPGVSEAGAAHTDIPWENAKFL